MEGNWSLFTKDEVLDLIQDFKLVTFECNNHCVILEA